MGRKRRLSGTLLTTAVSLIVCSCENEMTLNDERESVVTICLSHPSFYTKATIPDEDKVNDINLFIYEDGRKEMAFWKEDISPSGMTKFNVTLNKDRRYSLLAIANYGRKMDMMDYDSLKTFCIELARSDGYSNGIPMSAFIEEYYVDGSTSSLDMELIRMAAKISIRIDRSLLSEDVEMSVRKVRIGNCPKYVSVTGPSKITSIYDRFETGFELTEDQCKSLNNIGKGGLSSEVSVYMLENMQGKFPFSITEDKEKVLDADDPLSRVCSYIEMEIHYSSSELISYDSPLVYRFYLGEGLSDLDIERNCHYHITVTPEDDGLSGGGWRVDKSGIGPSTPVFEICPSDIVTGKVGDTLRVWCNCYPKTAPFDPGYEELEFDKKRGIYDYSVDDDKHGVTLFLKKPGTGIIYMTAGDPINQNGMVLVVVKS